MNWPNWFRGRSKGKARRTVIRTRKAGVAVEQLEPRIATGLTWTPDLGIDILGISAPAAGPYVVAGQWVLFQIVGSGSDWDGSAGAVGNTGQDEDPVTIVWSGAPCLVSSDGTEALCQIGTAGSPAIVDIFVDADDAAVVPAGDDGSRDDLAVHVSTQKYGIWVTIGLKTSQSMDPDDSLAGHPWFPGGPFELGPATSRTTQGIEQRGLWSRVELTGSIMHPSVPDGTGQFDWRQQSDLRICALYKDGDVKGSGRFTGEDKESPDEAFQTHETVNSKVFMLDAPGQGDFSGALFEEVIIYDTFTTWVNFNNVRVSADYEWFEQTTYRNDGTDYMFNHPVRVVIAGHNFNQPSGTPPVDDGTFPVDCSTQAW